MPKKRLTIRAQLALGLERLGYRRDMAHASVRYQVYADHRMPGRKLYLGKIDSLRRGRNIAELVPDDVLKLKALAEGAKKI